MEWCQAVRFGTNEVGTLTVAPPIHQFTNSPIHQFTNSPIHQFTNSPIRMSIMLLAGDVGGTKTLLGLFEIKPERPSAIDVGEFTTLDYSGLEPMIESFLQSRAVEARHIEAASFGVAGAVTDQVARLTNVPWCVDRSSIAERLRFKRSYVQNDLEA